MVAQTSKIGMAMGRALSMAMVAGGVAGFAGIFAMATREVIGFERKMVDVRANARLLGKEGGEAFELLNATARELGATTQFTAMQVAKALDWMVLGGLRAREAIEAVPGVLNLASSANLELAESAKIVVDNMRKYGMEASETGKIADFMSSAQSRAQITARDLAQGLQSLGSITTSMNVSFRDTVALLTGMGRAGTEMSRGGTALSMALFRLAAPPKEAERALQMMNIQVRSFVDTESGVLNLIGLFKAIALALPTDPIERGAAAAALFGMRAREVLGVLNLLRDTTFVEETQVGLIEDLGRSARVSEAKLETFWGMLKKVRSVLGELAIAGLTPVLKKFQPLLENIRAGTAMFTKFVTWVYKTGAAISDLPFGFLLFGFWDVTKAGVILTGGLISMQFAVGKLTLAYKALGGAMGMSMLVLGRWKIALIGTLAVLDAIMINLIAYGAILGGAVLANPVTAAALALLVATVGTIIWLGIETKKTNAIIEEGNKITEQFVERGKKQEANLVKQVARLLELSKAGRLSNEQMKEAQGIIGDLEGLYGSLGLKISQTTGGIIGMAKAIELLEQKNSKMQLGNLQRQLSDLNDKFREAEATSYTVDREDALLEMDRLGKKVDEVREKMSKYRSGPAVLSSVIVEGSKKDIDALRRMDKERAKAAFDAKKDLVSGIRELDPSTVRREFGLLSRQVGAIAREFPGLEGAARRFLELEWKKTPFGKVIGQLDDAKLKTVALTRGWENWRIELEKFARQPWVTPAQVQAMQRMLVMQNQLGKKRSEESRFEGMAKGIREEMRTPVDEMEDLAVEIGKLVRRGVRGLPGSLTPEEGVQRFQMERQRIQEGRPKEEITMGAGRFGFADFGKSLQDAFLKSSDPSKETAKNTAAANKLLGMINTGIDVLKAKSPQSSVYAR